MSRYKDPKDKEILASKAISRIKLLTGSALMAVGVSFAPIELRIGVPLIGISALLFIWDIFTQARSGITVEERISNLEDEIRKLKENPN